MIYQLLLRFSSVRFVDVQIKIGVKTSGWKRVQSNVMVEFANRQHNSRF